MTNSQTSSEADIDIKNNSDVEQQEKSTSEDMNYVYDRVQKILELPESGWHIIDRSDDLVMIHYDEYSTEGESLSWLRGVVVDYKRGIKVADSYGYNHRAVCSKIVPDQNNIFTVEDDDGMVHNINLNKAIINPGVEGVMIRVFKWNGQVYRVSHRRFNLSNSRRGRSLPFLHIYANLGGPTDDELFNSKEKFSPIVYMFLACHPDIVLATKDQIENGTLYYLGHRQMWPINPENCPLSTEDQDVVLNDKPAVIPNMSDKPDEIPNMSDKDYQPKIEAMYQISLQEANTLLYQGYQDFDDCRPIDWYDKIDERLRCGEFVAIHLDSGSLLIIESPAYRWRFEMVGENPNLFNQFYQLAECARIRDHRKFRDMFPDMHPYKKEEINTIFKSSYMIIWYPGVSEQKCFAYTFNQKLRNIWYCFLFSTPPCKQNLVVGMLDNYYKLRKDLINWATKIWRNNEIWENDLSDTTEDQKFIPIPNHNQRLTEIIASATDLSKKNMYNPSSNTKNLTQEQNFRKIVKSFLQNEKHISLYRMVRDFEKDCEYWSRVNEVSGLESN